MSFLVYLAVVLFAAASALFGLDLMTSPLPPSPSTQAASTSAPNKLEKREAERKTAADKQASNSDRALSPVYPANPGGAKPDVRMVYPPTNATAGAAPSEEKSASAPQQPAPDTTARAEAKEPVAKNEPTASAPAESAPAQPVAQQTANRCDVSACASAYRSFRASDCTYQPFSGPRRVCEAPPAAQARTARAKATDDARPERAAQRSRKDDLRDVVQRVKEMTRQDDDDDGADADDEADDAAPAAEGRPRAIILQRGFGGWRWEDDR